MSAEPPPESRLVDPDMRLLHDVATTVVHLAQHTRLDSFTLPYPPQAQRSVDSVILACLHVGAQPPGGLPELLHWCRTRPIANWPLDGVSGTLCGTEDRLIDRQSGEPTQLCHELAVDTRGDSSARQYDRMVVHEAMRACREASSPESYTAFRRLLVDRPVVTELDWIGVTTDLYLAPVRDLIDLIYAPVPASYLVDDAYYTPCARCLTLLTPLSGGGWWCERDHCRHQGAPPPAGPLRPGECGEVRQLDRPLRQFVTGPGRAETALEQALRRRKLTVEMWPGFDAYDLRITFPDGHVWAVDVKDWAHPGLLGRSARPVRPEPPYDEACWVVPQFRVEAQRSYLDVYARERPATAGGLRLLTDRELTSAADARLRGQRGPEARIGPLDTVEEEASHA